MKDGRLRAGLNGPQQQRHQYLGGQGSGGHHRDGAGSSAAMSTRLAADLGEVDRRRFHLRGDVVCGGAYPLLEVHLVPFRASAGGDGFSRSAASFRQAVWQWLFTVPTAMPRTSAVSASLSYS